MTIAYQVLAAVTCVAKFGQQGMEEHVKNNQFDISVDISFVMSNITKIISKWLKVNVRKKFAHSIPPPPEMLFNTENSSDTEKVGDENKNYALAKDEKRAN